MPPSPVPGQDSDRPEFIHADMSVPSRASVLWAFHGEKPEAIRHPEFGRHIIEHPIQEQFDVAQYLST